MCIYIYRYRYRLYIYTILIMYINYIYIYTYSLYIVCFKGNLLCNPFANDSPRFTYSSTFFLWSAGISTWSKWSMCQAPRVKAARAQGPRAATSPSPPSPACWDRPPSPRRYDLQSAKRSWRSWFLLSFFGYSGYSNCRDVMKSKLSPIPSSIDIDSVYLCSDIHFWLLSRIGRM